MYTFFLFSFIPLGIFSAMLWLDVRNRSEYTRRSKPLALSIILILLSGLILLPHFLRLPFIPPVAVLPLYVTVAFCYYLSFFFLEYSIHIQRIEHSYSREDFRKNYSILKKLWAVLGILAVFSFISLLSPSPESLPKASPVSSVTQTVLLLFVAFLAYANIFSLARVFNLPAGIIRRRRYPLLWCVIITSVPGLFLWFGSLLHSRLSFYFPVFLALNVVYVVRIYLEYLFYRTYHLNRRIEEQEERQHRRSELIAQVVNAAREEDARIIAATVQGALDEMRTSVVVKDSTFTGAMVFRRVGNSIRIESPELVLGYCTPLNSMENIKRIPRDQLIGYIMRQTLEYEKILKAEPESLASFGEKALRRMIDTKEALRIDPIPSCYRGLQELIYFVPIFNKERFDGFLVLYKDSFGGILPEEERILGVLIENLSIIFMLMFGKDVQVERNRLQGEIDIAQKIQTSIVPRSIEMNGYECAASMITATEVGGDVYDFFPVDGVNFLGIGDVAGHGLPAGIMALIQMSAFHGALETAAVTGSELAVHQIYDVVNRVLCRINRDRIGSDKFMTQNYFIEKDGRFIHAGTHEVALLYSRKKDEVIEIRECTNGTAFLGLSEHICSKASEGSFTIEPGDMLVLYTDGVIEAKNADSEQFGIDRLKQVIMRKKESPADELITEVVSTVSDFARGGDMKRHGGKFADDLTLVVLRKT